MHFSQIFKIYGLFGYRNKFFRRFYCKSTRYFAKSTRHQFLVQRNESLAAISAMLCHQPKDFSPMTLHYASHCRHHRRSVCFYGSTSEKCPFYVASMLLKKISCCMQNISNFKHIRCNVPCISNLAPIALTMKSALRNIMPSKFLLSILLSPTVLFKNRQNNLTVEYQSNVF